MEETDKAWLAAAIDGEGTVSILNDKRVDGTFRQYPYVAVYNNDRDFIAKIESLIVGGSVRERKYHVRGIERTNFRIQFVELYKVEKILQEVLPYLIIKKMRAIEVLKYVECRKKGMEFKFDESIFESLSRDAGRRGGLRSSGNKGDSEGHRRAALAVQNHHLKGNRGNPELHRRASAAVKNHHLKGNRGNSELHRKAAAAVKNHHKKGNRGSSEAHRLAALKGIEARKRRLMGKDEP